MSATASPGASWAGSRRTDFPGSIRRRMVLSIAATVAWLSAVLLFSAFWAGGFSLFQDIVVGIVSLLVLLGTLLGLWISFGMRFVGHWD